MKSLILTTIVLFSFQSQAMHACAEQVRSLVPRVRTVLENNYSSDLNRETYNTCMNFLETGANRAGCRGTAEWQAIRSLLQSQIAGTIRSVCVNNRTACYSGCAQIGLTLPRGGMPYAVSRINSYYDSLENQGGNDDGTSNR